MYAHIQNLYQYSGTIHYWPVVRYTSSLLRHTVDSISPFITAVLVHGKQVDNILLTKGFDAIMFGSDY